MQASTEKPMLQIKNAHKTFGAGTANQHVALNGLSLSLTKGEFVSIIGSNGAGKSTLFNAIGGVFYLDSGSVVLADRDITFEKEHKRATHVGRLFQDPMKGTAPDMTIEENLALAFSRKKIHPLSFGVKRKDVAYFRENLAHFNMGLEDRMKTKVGLLSGGQRQALSLLMSTMSKPELLLLDEHTAALDPAAAERIMGITNEIIEKDKVTTLMITHNIQDALKTGSRTIMMENGQIILDIAGQEREKMTVQDVMQLYSQKSNKQLTNDRMLLT